MKLIACCTIAMLSLSMLGCKPDAAVQRGAVVGAGPATSEKDVKKDSSPTITTPTTEKQAPLKQVQ